MPFTITKPEEVGIILSAVGAFLATVIGAIKGKAFYDKKYAPAPNQDADSPNPISGSPSMFRFMEKLKEYQTIRACDATHQGLCSKLDMIIKLQDEHHQENLKYQEGMNKKVDDLSSTLYAHVIKTTSV